jgi:hypothetical protein
MKVFWSFLLSIPLLVGYIQFENSNKILWTQNYSINWKDFKGKPSKKEGFDAMTAYVIESEKKNNKLGIYCYFEKKKSWRDKKKESVQLLKHEQYHFHLAEVYARKLRQQIIEQHLTSNMKQIPKVFNESLRKLEIKQKLYDKETNHSKVIEEQLKWEKIIETQLQELAAYSNPLVE